MNNPTEQLTFDISDLQSIKPNDGFTDFDNHVVANMGDPTAALYVAFPKAENPELGTTQLPAMLQGYVVNPSSGALDVAQPFAWYSPRALKELKQGDISKVGNTTVLCTGKDTGESDGKYFSVSLDDKHKLGQGTFGAVYRGFAINPVSGVVNQSQSVAIKQQQIPNQNPSTAQEQQKKIIREYLLTRHYQKAEMPIFVNDAKTPDEVSAFSVIEYFPGKDLYDFIVDGDINDLSTLEKFELILQIVLASHLFEYKTPTTGPELIHRDTKPENICVHIGKGKRDQRCISAYIIDYGLSEYAGMTEVTGYKGTASHFPPEILLPQPLTTAADSFALAAIFALILGVQNPWQNKEPFETQLTQATEDGASANELAAILTSLVNTPNSIDNIRIAEFGKPYDQLRTLTLQFLHQIMATNPNHRPSRDEMLKFFLAAVHYLRSEKIKDRIDKLQQKYINTKEETEELQALTSSNFKISLVAKIGFVALGGLAILAITIVILGVFAGLGDPLALNMVTSALNWLTSMEIIAKTTAMADVLLGVTITALATLIATLIPSPLAKMLLDKHAHDERKSHLTEIQNDSLAKMTAIVTTGAVKATATPELPEEDSSTNDNTEEGSKDPDTEEDSRDPNEALDAKVNELFNRMIQKKGGPTENPSLLEGHGHSPVSTALTAHNKKAQPHSHRNSLDQPGSAERLDNIDSISLSE